MKTRQDEKIETAARIAAIGIGLVVVCAGLRASQSVMAPTLLALVIGVVLSPVSDLWERLGLPRFLGALLSLILTVVVILVVAMLMLPVAGRIADAWPSIMGEVRGTLYQLQQTFRGLQDAGEEVQGALTGGGSGADESGGGVAVPTTTDALFLAPAVAGQTITFAGVLFFFLLTRREVYSWCARRIAPEHMEDEAASRLILAERQVARYFLTISLVNVGFGICTAAAMMMIGMPSPLLWGVACALLNYVLYLGPAILAMALLIGGIVIFDGFYAVVPVLAFVGLNLIEAQFVTPTAIGKALSVNPLLIFVSLVFFLWLWGPLGGFIAIPLLLWIMVLSNEIRIQRGSIEDEIHHASDDRTLP